MGECSVQKRGETHLFGEPEEEPLCNLIIQPPRPPAPPPFLSLSPPLSLADPLRNFPPLALPTPAHCPTTHPVQLPHLPPHSRSCRQT